MMDSDPFIGRLVAGRYQVGARIGRGGMGAVYIARQHALDRDVALKTIRVDMEGDELVRRFEREARAVARLNHPHIVVVHDFGALDQAGGLYLAMEYIIGTTLSQARRQVARMPADAVVRIAQDIASALEHAHGAGVVHRDLKPDNIMLLQQEGRSDYVKVLDFGIAKIAGTGEAALTSSRIIMGTPGYVAPEVIMDGMSNDARCDLYALGVMMFEMLSGRSPFVTSSPSALLVRQANENPPLTSAIVPDAPAALCALIDMLMRKEPSARPASAHAVLQALMHLPPQSTHPTTTQRFAALSTQLGGAFHDSLAAPTDAQVPSPTADLSAQASGFDGASVRPAPLTPSTPHAPLLSLPAQSAVGTLMLSTVARPASWWVGLAAAAVIATVAVAGFAARPAPVPALAAVAPALPVPAAVAPPVEVPVVPQVPAVVPMVALPVASAAPAKLARSKATRVAPKTRSEAARADAKSAVAVVAETGPPPLTSQLIKAGIVSMLGRASACTNTNIKRAPSGPGLLVDHCPSYRTIDGDQQVVMTVAPDGSVLSAHFLGGISGDRIAACVEKSIVGWTLPAFAGDAPVEIQQRVTFEPCVPINGKCVF